MVPTSTIDPGEGSVSCGCAEHTRASGQISRRAFLQTSAALGAAGVVAGVVGSASSAQYAFAAPGYTGDVVVVLSLRGGFDGLSAVPAIGDPAYAAARPNIGVPPSRAIRLDPMFGLHPGLRALKPLYDAGRLALVHAVGQQHPTRSHFVAMEEMENAAPGSNLRTGWLDRMIGLNATRTFSAVAVGGPMAPASLRGPRSELTVTSLQDFDLAGTDGAADFARYRAALTALHATGPATARHDASTALRAVATARRLADSAPAAHYPDSDVGAGLADVARMIKAGVGLRAATVDVGNWDMHEDQGRSDGGWMFDQLTTLGQALAAFAKDLGSKIDDVTLVTLSEFGRRVEENGSGGTDHGHGNVCFVLGGGVRGGKVYGRWPGLAASKLDEGDLAGTTDYRMILAEILEKRGKLATRTVFPGLAGDRLGLLRPRSS